MSKKTKKMDFDSKTLTQKTASELTALAAELRSAQLADALALGANNPHQKRETRRNRARVLTALGQVAQ